MNTHDAPNPDDDFALRRGLRQLPREREPTNDLWAGIEARLAPVSAARDASRQRRWLAAGLAAAASLALAIGVMLKPDGMAPTREPLAGTAQEANIAPPTLLRREADALTIEYETALAVFATAPLSPDLQAAATELDASAAQLRVALRAQPEATYLLDRLRRTYDQRLKLTQRAVLG